MRAVTEVGETSRVAAALGCFADLPLRQGLGHLAQAGFTAVDVDVREDGPVPPAMVRDDYETAHLLLGFECVRAGLQPASLRIDLPTTAPGDATTLLRSSCALVRAFQLPALTVQPVGEPPTADRLAEWLRLAHDCETELRLFLADPEAVMRLGRTAARLGMELSTAAPLLPTMRQSADALAQLTEVWMTVAPTGRESVPTPALSGFARGARLVLCCPPTGEPAARIERLSAVRQSLENALRNPSVEKRTGTASLTRKVAAPREA